MAAFTVGFIGRVYPDVDLTFPSIPTLSLHLTDGEMVVLKCSLEKSRLRVICEIQEYPLDGRRYTKYWDLYRGVSEMCHAFIDLASFTHGVSLTLIFERFVDPTGKEERIVETYPDLKAAALAPFPFAFKAAIENWHVRFALHDLAGMLARAQLIPVNSAHAIEIIAKAISPQGTPEQRWMAMQKNLKCSEQYLKFITDVSKVPRHGGLPQHPIPELWKCRSRTWIVVNRYLEFLIRGGIEHLPDAEFPIL